MFCFGLARCFWFPQASVASVCTFLPCPEAHSLYLALLLQVAVAHFLTEGKNFLSLFSAAVILPTISACISFSLSRSPYISGVQVFEGSWFFFLFFIRIFFFVIDCFGYIKQLWLGLLLLFVKQPVHFPVGLNIGSESDVMCLTECRCMTCVQVGCCFLRAGGMLHHTHTHAEVRHQEGCVFGIV